MSLSPAQHFRIRLHLALLPVYVWIALAWGTYAADISTPGRLDRSGHIKGHDFVHFYVLGEIARAHAVDELYSFDAQAARTDRLVPQYPDRFLPVHAPQVSMFFAPLAAFRYENALAIWLAVSAVLYAICCLALWKACPSLAGWGWAVFVLSAGNPAFFSLIAAGQTSAFALLWFTLAFFALTRGHPWLAGLALGMLVYKPTLGIAVAVVCLVTGRWRVIAGAAVGICAEFAAAALYFGPHVLADYAANVARISPFSSLLEARPELMHSIRAFFVLLMPSLEAPWPWLVWAASAAASIVVLALLVQAWRRNGRIELQYVTLMLATVLVNPHVYTYELVVLVPAFFTVANAIRDGKFHPALTIVAALAYALPAFDMIPSITRVQVSVVMFLVLFTIVARQLGSRRPLGRPGAE